MRPVDKQILFREAVLDLADAPTQENVRRYLAASQLLAVRAALRTASCRDRPPPLSPDTAPADRALRARPQ